MADYVFRAGDLPKLDLNVDRGSDFLAWKSQWDAYLSLSGLGTQAQEKRVQALTLCLSRETVTIVENLGLSEAQRGNAGDIVKAMGVYVTGQLNESVERRTFRRRTQSPLTISSSVCVSWQRPVTFVMMEEYKGPNYLRASLMVT